MCDRPSRPKGVEREVKSEHRVAYRSRRTNKEMCRESILKMTICMCATLSTSDGDELPYCSEYISSKLSF